MANAYSIRESLQGALQDYVRESGFSCIHLEELVRELIGLLASYREESAPLFPEVFVFASQDGLQALAPSGNGIKDGLQELVASGNRVNVGTVALRPESASVILKNCASLADGGWAVFVVKEEEDARYGLFRSIRHSLAIGAEESMRDLGKDVPVIFIRNRGHLVVELLNTVAKRFTVALTTTPAQPSPLEADVDRFVDVVALAVQDSETFKPYLRRLLTVILQNCHGTLLAAIEHPFAVQHPTLGGGVWPQPPLALADLHFTALRGQTAEALADLNAAESLLRGMIHSDGVVIFGTDGTVLAFRLFLRPETEERGRIPELGGGRRRTYELMRLRLSSVFRAVLFRSQDGETKCERSNL